MIRFKKLEETAILHSPLKEFQLDFQPIEYREDPLTGLTSFVRTGRAFWAGLYKTDEALIEKLSHETQSRCFFCPDKSATATPKFPADLIPEGRLSRGEAVLFPNLFAQKGYSAIVAITQKHYLRLNEFQPALLSEAFKLAAIYLQRVYETGDARYAEIGANYLYPAGASIMHPHLQVIASHGAYYLIKLYMEKGKEHYRRYSQNYWAELIKKEQRLGERYIGSIGNTEWYTPFAPTREDEVNAVVRGKSNFAEFDASDWENMADGLCRVLKYYHDQGLSCFNYALYSGPLNRRYNFLWAGMKIISRSSVQPYPVSDNWYSSNILLDGFITEPPESIASALRPYFVA